VPPEYTYDYAIVRVVPRVERGEQVNVGVILSCADLDFLDARIEVDEARLLALAAAQSASNPVSAVLEYMRAHLYESLTVADLADLVSLSPSAFAHLFRDVTGRSPYQFLKEMRLDRARELLVDGHLTVARISKEVGYASVSHFISEFRGRFGVTPRAYYDAQALHRELDTQRARDDTGATLA